MKSKKQTGSIGVGELMFIVIITLAAFSLAIVMGNYQAGKAEISPAAYAELRGLAAQSCAGRRHLKDIVSRGAIHNGEYVAVRNELDARKVSAETNAEKAAITGQSQVCIG